MYSLLITLLYCQSLPVFFKMCLILVQFAWPNAFCQSMKEAYHSSAMFKVHSNIIVSRSYMMGTEFIWRIENSFRPTAPPFLFKSFHHSKGSYHHLHCIFPLCYLPSPKPLIHDILFNSVTLLRST